MAKPSRALITRPFSEIAPRALHWLWPERIPLGKLTMIAGEPGLGKSLATCDIAARVSTGRPFPGCEPPAKSASVLMLSAEDDPDDTIRPRLDAAGAATERVHLIDGRPSRPGGPPGPVTLPHDVDAIGDAIQRIGDARLLVIDPVSAYIGERDDHKNAVVRGILAPLAALAREMNVAALCVSHLNKGQARAVNRITGSGAYVAAPRAVYVVAKDRDDDGRRLLLPIKHNLGPDAGGFAYRVESEGADAPPRVVWEPGTVDVSADDALREADGDGPSPKVAEARGFLLGRLADGPQRSKQLHAIADRVGISGKTLERAKRTLGVSSDKAKGAMHGDWLWRLPPEPNPAVENGHLGHLRAETPPEGLTAPDGPRAEDGQGAQRSEPKRAGGRDRR